MHGYGSLKRCEQIIDEQRKTGDVVEMSMRKNDVPHLLALLFARRESQTSGIDRDRIINYKTSKVLPIRCSAVCFDGTGQ
jgi:hypothetical protein